MNVFYNCIPNKWIAIDDKDPPWMNDEIKSNINCRNTFHQQLKKYKTNLIDPDVVDNLTSELLSIVYQRIDVFFIFLKNSVILKQMQRYIGLC